METVKWLYHGVTNMVSWKKHDDSEHKHDDSEHKHDDSEHKHDDSEHKQKKCKVYIGKKDQHWFVIYGSIKFELLCNDENNTFVRFSLPIQNNSKLLYQVCDQSDKTVFNVREYALEYVNLNSNYKLIFNDCQGFAVHLIKYLVDASAMAPSETSRSYEASKRMSVASIFTLKRTHVKYDYVEHIKSYDTMHKDRQDFIDKFIIPRTPYSIPTPCPVPTPYPVPIIRPVNTIELNEILESCYAESSKLSDYFIELNKFEEKFQNKYYSLYSHKFQSEIYDCVNFQQFICHNFGDVYDIISNFEYLVDEKYIHDQKQSGSYYTTNIPTINSYIFNKNSDVREIDTYDKIFYYHRQLMECNIISQLTKKDIQRHIDIFYGRRNYHKNSAKDSDKSWATYRQIAKKLCKDLNGHEILSLKWHDVTARFNVITCNHRNIICDILDSFYYPFIHANEFCKKMIKYASETPIYRYQEDAESLLNKETNVWKTKNIYNDCGLSLFIDYCLFPLQKPLFPNIICKFLSLKLVQALLEYHPRLSLNKTTTGNLYSCLHVVIWFDYPHRSLETIKLLIAYDANIQVKNGKDETAIDAAIAYSRRWKIKSCPILQFLQDPQQIDAFSKNRMYY